MGWSLERMKALLKPAMTENEDRTAQTADGPPPGGNVLPARDMVPLDEPQSPQVILISVIGLSAAERDHMLDWMIEDCQTSGKVPVFVTDDLDLHPWLTRELMVEHLPSMERQGKIAPDLDWDLYLKRRLDFLRRKWRVDRVVDLGQALNGLVQGSADSTTDVDTARQALSSR